MFKKKPLLLLHFNNDAKANSLFYELQIFAFYSSTFFFSDFA